MGQIAFHLFAVALTGVLAALFVASVVDAGEPIIWGTFTEEYCEDSPRRGCRPVGTWTSHDGTIVKHDIYLDGAVGVDGTAPASYRPTGIMSNNVVHTTAFTGILPWLTGGLLLWWAIYSMYKATGWGDLNWLFKLLPEPFVRSAANPDLTTRRGRRRARAAESAAAHRTR
ncbi:hypothetical protein [Microbacterium sp. cx-55]|uniref:hypothetical protein n=1 Tax=Microbacterium sp. cx-55 TaxID=2875948 RepID=UPI001CBCE248|nr:hypothetical protein [Microbacterium sp. cx-55]MBZ4488182.1 hypothetical protein [Microbacterium sp. cx-55]